MIGGNAIHSRARQAGAAKDVASTNDHSGLHAHLHDVVQLASDTLEYRRIHAVVRRAEQRFTGQLDENPGEPRLRDVTHFSIPRPASKAVRLMLKKTPLEAGFLL